MTPAANLTYGCRRCGHSTFTYTEVAEYAITGDDLEARGDGLCVDGTGDKRRVVVDAMYRCAACGFARRDATQLVTDVQRRAQ